MSKYIITQKLRKVRKQPSVVLIDDCKNGIPEISKTFDRILRLDTQKPFLSPESTYMTLDFTINRNEEDRRNRKRADNKKHLDKANENKPDNEKFRIIKFFC